MILDSDQAAAAPSEHDVDILARRDAEHDANQAALTDDERKAIGSLRRLARRWPQTLELFSASGTLCVVRAGDPRMDHTYPGDRTLAVIDTIDGIPNDGGDW